ncbi:AAA family ATPase [Microbacterium rhizomatis]|uniref:Nuclease SbcCD subunit C n=1 Tax=Microbacterium rhizomatis TaxID=1631477 RepID=A0A5J5J8L2_9MICO|nr:AAA family ATPase [Microbacterium rhizomatis]KAA9111514.1 AAA family ATPase [Microbacterium rhizomatis]
MRLHLLELEGFGPFRRPQTVDFDALARDGIFLIGGKTGAGKSSILDAVCFALYGGVPRYEEGEKRIRSDHSALDEPTRVRLEFSSGGRRWRVERVPTYERLKRNGRGTTLTPAEARLEEWIDDRWVGRAARPVDVGHELGPILGLNQHQFLQVILLAQGRFAQFLLARNDERQTLLRTLFDSKRFRGYEESLERRRKATLDRLALENRTLLAQLENAERLARVDAGEPGRQHGDPESLGLDERVERVRQAGLKAAHQRELSSAREGTARAAHLAADAAHAGLVAQRSEQIARNEARAALFRLDERSGEITATRAVLAAAEEAEPFRPLIAALDRADAAAREAAAAHADVLARWVAAGESAEDETAVTVRADALIADVGAWKAGQEAEDRLGRLASDRAATASLIAAADDEIAAIHARRAALPALLEGAAAAIAAARVQADAEQNATARLDTARLVRAAAERAEQRRAAVAIAETAAAATGRALTRASAALDDLRDRRFRDHAGELAETLVDGDPCPVCGACEHPAPTARSGEPVTDDDIAAAEAHKAAAVDADAAATNDLRSARDAVAAAAAQAGGLTPEAATAAVAAAEAELAAAVAAAGEHARLLHERSALEAESAALESAHLDLTTARAEAAAALAGVDRSIAEAEQAVRSARGDHESVAARVDAAQRIIRLARELAAATGAVRARGEAVESAAAAWEKALGASRFDSRDEVLDALRDGRDRELLDATVREYDAQRAGVTQNLLALELRMLPEELVDIGASDAALASASDAWRAAVASSAEAAALAQQLDEAVEATDIAHEVIAALTAEAGVIERLANSVAGRAPNTRKMNLETFVLAAELEEIVAAANERLDEMTQGRYRLRHTDAKAARGAASGLGIDVVDAFTGQPRPVQSLSGGETFLASLALALGLAEVVTARAGGIRLDTLFIDEGFGSLDADTLDVAMRTLDELRQGGRVVGVISHVEAMKDQLPAQLTVRTGPHGDSLIDQDLSVTA